MINDELKDFLDQKVMEFNVPGFIENDPIIIPHLFSVKQDIEIAGFFAAILAWGKRKTIIKKCKELLSLMDNDPHAFIIHHEDSDLKLLKDFKHRTFNGTDTLYFIAFLKSFYQQHPSLEVAFTQGIQNQATIENGLVNFRELFFSLPYAPERTKKHVATPARKSACKRINMFLRWMVRNDNCGVDFGLWSAIKPSQLVCPCDIHVDRVARKIGLIQRKQTDWQTAIELTNNLKLLDANDPVKYDFALFGLGVTSYF